MSTVEVTSEPDGTYRAVHEETGTVASGASESDALVALGVLLASMGESDESVRVEFTVEPSLSPEFEERAERGREQIERGEYVSLDDL